jgi:hypothetical protein
MNSSNDKLLSPCFFIFDLRLHPPRNKIPGVIYIYMFLGQIQGGVLNIEANEHQGEKGLHDAAWALARVVGPHLQLHDLLELYFVLLDAYRIFLTVYPDLTLFGVPKIRESQNTKRRFFYHSDLNIK